MRSFTTFPEESAARASCYCWVDGNTGRQYYCQTKFPQGLSQHHSADLIFGLVNGTWLVLKDRTGSFKDGLDAKDLRAAMDLATEAVANRERQKWQMAADEVFDGVYRIGGTR